MDHGTKHAVQLVRSFDPHGLAMFSYGLAIIRYARFIEGWTEHTVQLGGWPSWIDQNDQLGRWPSWIDHATDQLGHSPIWIENATSSAIRRTSSVRSSAEPVQFGGWLSWIKHATSSADGRAGTTVLSSSRPSQLPPFEIRTNLLLFHLDRSHRWNFTI
ncbi:hypothetical protein F2Q70_00043138 [Brassica cretica]|uniref:Uncharacterized protein n=1 Tax=Brassica cretica TaxID=69181 RepID=A0A8S9KIQ7_BRACR|nr:hypothetical protein F2Q70_00043138 [Brassica cretica]